MASWHARALERDRHLPAWIVRQCQRKVRHPSREAAEVVRARRAMPDVVYVYQCMRCRGWHLGTPFHNHGRRR
jgi:hypothetical protein